MKLKHKGYIYLFRKTKDNSPVYVGQHNGSKSEKYFTSSRILNRIFNKIGREEFWLIYKREIVENNISTSEELDVLEIKYIKMFNTYNGENVDGYNLTKGGGTTNGFRMTKEQREVHRLRIKEMKRLNPVTEETKKKLSIANKGNIPWIKGKKLSDEQRKKLSISKLGSKNPNYNKKPSQSTINKCIVTKKKNGTYRKVHSREIILKITLKTKGLKRTIEQRARNGATHSKKIVQLDKVTGALIKIHSSQLAAVRDLKLRDSSGISSVCNGKSFSSSGYRWLFYEKYINKVGYEIID